MLIRNAAAGIVAFAIVLTFAQPSRAEVSSSAALAAAPFPQGATVGAEKAKAMADEGPVSLFDRVNDEVTVLDPSIGALSLKLPGQTTSDTPRSELRDAAVGEGAGEVLGVTAMKNASIATFDTERGFQSLISIHNSQAPLDYEFTLNLPEDAAAAMRADGSVAITDAMGAEIGGFETPWAYDANGATVATRFTLVGNKLIQTVEHTADMAYPVVADPSTVWGWTQCVAAVTVWAAGNALVAAKIATLVRRFGSIRRAVEIGYRAYRAAAPAKRGEAVAKALGAIAGELLGVGQIKSSCFDS